MTNSGDEGLPSEKKDARANSLATTNQLQTINRREFLIAGGATTGAIAFSPVLHSKEPLHVTGLKVDYLEFPLGLENAHPRFSWRLESKARNVRQRAYRILVASSEAALGYGRGDLWDSGKTDSSKSHGIKYQGRTLISRQRCWWKVHVWDEDGSAGESGTGWWEMALLEPSDWTAQWLMVEDSISKADREFGLRWVWGGLENERGWQFRVPFDLPTYSSAGNLVVVLSDWNTFAQIGRIWLDGEAIAGPGPWVDDGCPESGQFVREQLQLPVLAAGRHLIAVQINMAARSAFMTQTPYVPGLALFLRLQLVTGEVIRIGSGTHCKIRASSSSGSDWRTLHYDDSEWQLATPAPIEGYQPWPARPAMYLRKRFEFSAPPADARLYITALGAYEAYINGQRVGDALLAPEISQYAARVLYQVHDVTSLLKPGANALGLVVGDGWYASFDGRFAWGPPPLRTLVQLELKFADGSRQLVTSGQGWRISESPIRMSEIRSGEVHDARSAQPGWNTAEFDDRSWKLAQVGESPNCRLTAQTSPPIRVSQKLRPQRVTQTKSGVYIFDFGQAFSGWCRLRAKGVRGSHIELRFAESLTSAGDVDVDFNRSMGEPKRDVFILSGTEELETFEPRFTYRGFRYVQVTGLQAPPHHQTLEGIVVHSDLRETGRLLIDSPVIEQTWRNTVWTQRSNFVSIPTDCPSREQRGWLGDAGIFWDAAAFNMDICAFTRRVLDNIVDQQAMSGALPAAAPEPQFANALFFTKDSTPAWADGAIVLLWTAWRRYGDTAILEQHWQAMNRYLNHVHSQNPNYIWQNGRGLDLGDHRELPDTPSDAATSKELLATAYWAHSTDLMAEMAQAIRLIDDSARLRELSRRIREAFNSRYVKADATVGTGTQTSYALALQFGLLPEHIRAQAAQRLADDIRQRGLSLTTGIVGTQFVLDVLADMGFAGLVYRLLLRTEYPSWGHMIASGATTIWESWSGRRSSSETSRQLSHNHFAFGSVCGFLFRRVVGLDAETPGFETIVIRPLLDKGIKYCRGDYESLLGQISVEWSPSSVGFLVDVSIPANTTARVYLPTTAHSKIEESGQQIHSRRDLRVIGENDDQTVIEIGSGQYRFTVTG